MKHIKNCAICLFVPLLSLTKILSGLSFVEFVKVATVHSVYLAFAALVGLCVIKAKNHFGSKSTVSDWTCGIISSTSIYAATFGTPTYFFLGPILAMIVAIIPHKNTTAEDRWMTVAFIAAFSAIACVVVYNF